MKIIINEEQYNQLIEGSHPMKQMRNLLYWAEKMVGCTIKEVKNGYMICPPMDVKQPCYTTHKSDTGVNAVLAFIGKWFGVNKHVAKEAFTLNVSVLQMKTIMGLN